MAKFPELMNEIALLKNESASPMFKINYNIILQISFYNKI